MSPVKLTEEIARVAARDAGNRSMRMAGRAAWNEEDFVVAAMEYERLWPAPQAMANS